MRNNHVVIIGAGIGGLVAALLISARGNQVTVLERGRAPGGKLRAADVAGRRVDAGPTVFTLRGIFDEIFAQAGARLEDHLAVEPARLLARHAWSEGERFDLFADMEQAIDAIGDFAGAGEARRYREFCARAQRVFATLDEPFMRQPGPKMSTLIKSSGLGGVGDLWSISPYSSLWRVLGTYFRDPRLRQLFARYATYCGSSPYLSPATLMLVAHVEQQGVWLVDGGMQRIAETFSGLAASHGAVFRYGAEATDVGVRGDRVSSVTLDNGDVIEADAVIVNADSAAVAGGLLGPDIAPAVPPLKRSRRSLSAVTWALHADVTGFPLVRHTVFFSRDYRAEFGAILERDRLPADPTVYVCAQDRDDESDAAPDGPERLLCIVNAPASGDRRAFTDREIEECEERMLRRLESCGARLHIRPDRRVVRTPVDFNRLYPGTGGAIYGPASHGWKASFERPGCRTSIPGLYLAGGSVHPGPGLPMAALSGRLAADSVIQDLASTRRYHPAAISGGMSTP